MIDRIEEICYNDYIKGVKCITLSEDILSDHFPGNPVYPGCLIQESLAQLGGIFFNLMMMKEGKEDYFALLSVVNKMKFKKIVKPGDRLVMIAEPVTRNEDFGVMAVKAKRDNNICTTGELIFVFAKHTDSELKNHLKLYYKVLMKDCKIVS